MSQIQSTNLQDVVYLKDGSAIRGTIIEQIPTESLKIQTRDGSVFVYDIQQVKRIVKEPILVQPAFPQALPTNPLMIPDKKSPGVAFGLSFLIVGAGQVYNGHDDKAIGHWIVAGITIAMIYEAIEDNYGNRDPDSDNVWGVAGIAIGLSNWAWSMIDAANSAAEINAQNRILYPQQRAFESDVLQKRNESNLAAIPIINHKEIGGIFTFRF
jgi:hypothetical protein